MKFIEFYKKINKLDVVTGHDTNSYFGYPIYTTTYIKNYTLSGIRKEIELSISATDSGSPFIIPYVWRNILATITCDVYQATINVDHSAYGDKFCGKIQASTNDSPSSIVVYHQDDRTEIDCIKIVGYSIIDDDMVHITENGNYLNGATEEDLIKLFMAI